ncbi:MAG: cyclic nucleotide-binding domain-containing protein, partial [Candidatus Neomarinimicrobiota bacterium]|jgi:CRP-like cAMP-binding protein|nr:cyclic nucleotide-binding domain-containing protein [Candidatus Neomarinimicrobiota bacterium]
VKITIGTRAKDENILAELREGDFFGELALFDDEPRSANAIATKDSELLGLFQQDLFTLQERNPVLGLKILLNLGRVLGDRLRGTNNLLIQTQAEKSE